RETNPNFLFSTAIVARPNPKRRRLQSVSHRKLFVVRTSRSKPNHASRLRRVVHQRSVSRRLKPAHVSRAACNACEPRPQCVEPCTHPPRAVRTSLPSCASHPRAPVEPRLPPNRAVKLFVSHKPVFGSFPPVLLKEIVTTLILSKLIQLGTSLLGKRVLLSKSDRANLQAKEESSTYYKRLGLYIFIPDTILNVSSLRAMMESH
uniref:Uncharacterized protein n=1 Tax=Cucumis melo TaxID=3656 RepID=A0A9I9E7U9_CUCME